jgi:DNA polymerase-1
MSKKLYIIDGHSHLYASFYAIRNLTSPTGQPTNAVYGMTAVMLKILRDHHPDYLVTVFDPPGKTYRDSLFAEYKANRPPMPEDLVSQLPIIQQVLIGMGITTITTPGFEADDLIACLARQAVKQSIEVVICSKDKDLEQLISPGITIYDTTKDKKTDAESLLVEKGLTPAQVVDYLALMGDAVDNVPGLPGVGPKTAQKLIKEFGSIEKILENPDKLPPKVKIYLDDPANVEKLYLSKKLVTLLDEVPFDFEPEKWQPTIPDRDHLAQLFTQLGFTRFLQQLGLCSVMPPQDSVELAATTAAPTDKPKFEQIRSFDQLRELVKKWSACEKLAMDTETTSVDAMNCELVGLSFATDATTGWYLPIKTNDAQHLNGPEALAIVKPLLENPAVKKIGQNLKYDLLVLKNNDIETAGIYFDTMIASYLLDPCRPSHGMDYLANEFLKYETTKISELIGPTDSLFQQATLDQVATDRVTNYSAEDAWVTYRLYETFSPKLKEAGLMELFTKIEMPMMLVLVEMEFAGVAIDTDKLRKLSKELRDRTIKLSDEIFKLSGRVFNIDSPKQLAEVLFDELKLPATKLTKTGRSTDVQVLEELAWKHPMPKLVLEYRQLIKLKNTYIDKLPIMLNPRTHRIHTSFNQTITATGRLSSSEPNLQNIPIRSEIGKQIRSAFVPSDPKTNCLLTCDYSQVELRLLAHLSHDEHLISAFKNDRDIHAFVASQVFGVDINLVTSDQRRVAKTVNFGIIYGQTAHGLAQTLGIGRSEAQLFIDNYFKQYPRVRGFINQCIEEAKKTGYATTMMGRRRAIPDINSKNPNQRSFAERTAVNTVVQGSAADMIKIAMINIASEIHRNLIPAKMLIQVHDELVFEVPQEHSQNALAKIVELMSTAMTLEVPVKVDAACGENWLESK